MRQTIQRPWCNLKQLRIDRKFTQEKLAARLNIRPSSVAQLENNKRGASVEIVVQLMEILCVRFEDIYPRNGRLGWLGRKDTEETTQTLIV
jgi:DNA-binding XRE family transcriptional regulator